MATISNTPRPGYVYDSADAVWYPIGTGTHSHNEIATTIVDAKGDLIAATAADTVARLAVGNSGETLVADSATATGLNYKPLDAAGKNGVINGGIDIWQRGTSIAVSASTAPYTADRWVFSTGPSAASTVSRQSTNDTTNLPSIQYCARVQRNSGQTGTGANYFAQSLETTNSFEYVGKSVTLSFYARKGANFSGASDLLGAVLVSGTGTDQNVITAYTGTATVATSDVTLTATWQRFTITGTVATTATELAAYFSYTPSGTASTNDYYEITGVQLELGSTATVFSRTGGTIQGELAACQRYYQTLAEGSMCGRVETTSQATLVTTLPVVMRTLPAATLLTGTNALLVPSVAFYSPTAIGGINGTGASVRISFTGASGMTVGNVIVIATAIAALSSEL
jgi:hypothetical protein